MLSQTHLMLGLRRAADYSLYNKCNDRLSTYSHHRVWQKSPSYRLAPHGCSFCLSSYLIIPGLSKNIYETAPQSITLDYE